MKRRVLSGLSCLALGLAILVAAAAPSGAHSTGAATRDAAPVNLATPVDMAAGAAHRSAIVHRGDVRIEVLTTSLLRLEYSPTQHFENDPTVNILNRRMAVPRYSVSTAAGWLTVRTSRATLRYKLASGPFTPLNTSLRLVVRGHASTVAPTWDWECTFGQVCQAGAATMAGGAALSQTFDGYESTAGYAGFFVKSGASVTWHVIGSKAGTTVISLRYSNVTTPPLAPTTSALDLIVNGRLQQSLAAAPTSAAEPWTTLTAAVPLKSGTNSIKVVSTTPNSFDLGLDTLAVGPSGSPTPAPASNGPLGGWFRGFDTDTYNDLPVCGPGESGATCQAVIQPLNTDGLLDTAGWRLLDDTQSAVWTTNGWVTPRSSTGDVEDGYLFVYGDDYSGALRTLARVTGAAPLLPRNVFGVWYSDYTPYSSSTIENTLYPQFVRSDVPLNTLSLDTDWKAPNDWNGWEWNPSLFPSPSSFLHWASSHGIDVTLNIHSSIEDNDPKLPQTEHIAGNDLASSTCTNGTCKVWDWSSIPQAESNFALQQPLQSQGVSFWWLDWCCDDSVVSSDGVTPDAWIDHLYAQDMVNVGQRGFVLARIGGSNGEPQQVYPAGAWSNHTSTLAFTGDAWGTWNTLAASAALVPDEATIGEPYVSTDIGSYLGPPPTQAGADPPDLYDRWVQLGTFQPILRLHSNDENRLPWEYPQPVQGITETFLRLREALLPYTYTLAAQAHQTGLPMARPLYLDYPDQPSAYQKPTEYLYGPDMLVAPVTTPGDTVSTTVWFPPGKWVDFFTGATFSGPSSATMAVPLNQMPVFVRQGGIVTEQPSTGGTGPLHSLTALVYPGSRGSFDLYGDAGTGLGYTKGQRTQTLITTSSSTPTNGRASVRVTIGRAQGSYPGEPGSVATTIKVMDVTRPNQVTVDGRKLGGQSWSYGASTSILTVDLGSHPVAQNARVVAVGATVLAPPG
ncbi:MAG: TIM-barrel domain-containing protein [Acidimicrobiales bacterium]